MTANSFLRKTQSCFPVAKSFHLLQFTSWNCGLFHLCLQRFRYTLPCERQIAAVSPSRHPASTQVWKVRKWKKQKLWKPFLSYSANCLHMCVIYLYSRNEANPTRNHLRVSEGKNLWAHTNFLRFVECHVVLLSWWCCHLCMLEGDTRTQRDVLFNNCLKTGHCGNRNVTNDVGFCGILWYILQWICR